MTNWSNIQKQFREKFNWKDCGKFDPKDEMVRECYRCGFKTQFCASCNLDHHIDDRDKAIESWLKSTLKEVMTEMAGERLDEFYEVFDNSGHRYQIPFSKRDEWFKFCEIPEDDEKSWEVPNWAERIDNMPLKDNRGYNQKHTEDKEFIKQFFKE